VAGPSDFDTPTALSPATCTSCLSAGEAVCLTRRPFLPHRQLRASGVYTYASGRPFTVSAGGARANALDPLVRWPQTPNLIGTPHIVGNVDCWSFASNDKTARDPMSRSCSRPDRRVISSKPRVSGQRRQKHAARAHTKRVRLRVDARLPDSRGGRPAIRWKSST